MTPRIVKQNQPIIYVFKNLIFSFTRCERFESIYHHPLVVLKVIRSPAVGDFYVTGIEILAGFGRVGNTEKKGLGW